MPVLEAHLDGASAPDPGEVGGELPAVVLLVPERRPGEPERVVGGVAGEVDLRRPRVPEDQAALLLGAPHPLRPVGARREAGAAHVPAVPGHDRVAHEVVVDDPVPLRVEVARVDPLREALAEVVGVRGRVAQRVARDAAALGAAAVTNRRAVVVVAADRRLELVGERVVDARQDHFRVQLPRLVARGVAGHVVRDARPVGLHQQVRVVRGDLAAQRVAGGDDVARVGVAHRNPVDEPRRRRVEDLAPHDGPPERVHADLRAGQERAEVARPERRDRHRVAEALQRARAEPGPVVVDEEERLVLDDGPADGRSKVLVAERRLGQVEEALRVEGVARVVGVGARVDVVGARLGRVLDEAAARVAVLGGVGRRDDRDLLDALDGRSALLAPLVPRRVAEGAAVEEVLGGAGLAAVDARVELAAAEHRVAVRCHRQVAGLHQEHRLGQADVGGGHDRQVLVVLLVHAVASRPAAWTSSDSPPVTSIGLGELRRPAARRRGGSCLRAGAGSRRPRTS